MKNALLVALGLALVFYIAKDTFDGRPENPDAALQTSALIERLEAEGWSVLPAEEFRNLNLAIIDLVDDTLRMGKQILELAEEVRTRGGELRAVTEFYAQATADMRSLGQAFGDTLLVDRALPDSVVFQMRDAAGTFGGTAAVYPQATPWELRASVFAMIRGAVTITEAPDGRMLFGAVAEDPRVSLALQTAYWSPPPPVKVCTLGQRASAAGIGSLVTLGGIAAWVLH